MASKHNILRTMSDADIRRLAVAVAFLFAMIGPLTLLMDDTIIAASWLRLLVMTVVSGAFSASIILAKGNPFKLLGSVLIYICITLLLAFVRFEALEPDVPAVEVKPGVPFALSREQLADLNVKRTMFGMTAILCLTVGYALFVRVISRENKRRAAVEAEMKLAQRIHASLLPKGTYTGGGCEAGGISVPATEVGGDFFDVVRLGPASVLVVAADASGHGTGAGVLSAMTKSALLQEARHTHTPAALLTNVNRTLFAVTERNMFITCAAVLVDTAAKRAEVVTAGHPPVLVRRRGGRIEEVRIPGVALGIAPETEYRSAFVSLEDADAIFLFTDGAVECRNSSGEEFGPERLRVMLATLPLAEAGAMSVSAVEQVRTFAGKSEIQDDITIVCVKVNV